MARMSPLEILMALTVPLVWGMGFVLAKGAIDLFPPILLMAFRFTVTALLLVGRRRSTGRSVSSPSTWCRTNSGRR